MLVRQGRKFRQEEQHQASPRPPCSGKQCSYGFLLALGGTRAANRAAFWHHFPLLIMAAATPSQAFTAGPWIINCDLISTPTGSVAQILPCYEEEANARLIAQAPALLKSCQDFVDSVDMGDLFDHDVDCQEPETCIFCIARQVIADAGG